MFSVCAKKCQLTFYWLFVHLVLDHGMCSLLFAALLAAGNVRYLHTLVLVTLFCLFYQQCCYCFFYDPVPVPLSLLPGPVGCWLSWFPLGPLVGM